MIDDNYSTLLITDKGIIPREQAGWIEIINYSSEGITIKTPEGRVITVPDISPSTLFSLRDDDKTINAH